MGNFVLINLRLINIFQLFKKRGVKFFTPSYDAVFLRRKSFDFKIDLRG